MEVEYVSRECFASWWAAEKQRELTVGDSVLGEVIIDDQRVLPVVTEVLTHCGAGEGRDKLQGCCRCG